MRKKTSMEGGKVLKIILFGFSFFCFDFDNFTFRVLGCGVFFVVLSFICSFLGGFFFICGFSFVWFLGVFWCCFGVFVCLWFLFGFVLVLTEMLMHMNICMH